MTTTADRAATHATTLANGKNLFIHKFELRPTGLVAHGDPSFAEWEALGCFLQVMERAIGWYVGDWLNYGEGHYGERAAQAVDATGLEPATIGQYAWVAGSVPIARRNPSLSFSHHREVADMPPTEQTRWLDTAARGADGTRWSVDKLRREINEAKHGGEQTYWLMVQCQGKDDLERMTSRLKGEGRIVKTQGE